MKSFITTYLVPSETTVLDVGSYDLDPGSPGNGTYRNLIPDPIRYLGCDLCEGPNVDCVMPSPSVLPFPDETFEWVISGQMLEHAREPQTIAKEMGRVLKRGGYACWIAPWRCEVHERPDYWRILPDGMTHLLESSGLTPIRVESVDQDTIGIGHKL